MWKTQGQALGVLCMGSGTRMEIADHPPGGGNTVSQLLPIGAGLVIGFLIGITGMGGGALMTPFLLIVLKMNPVAALGTDLSFAAITKVVGGIGHWREDNGSFREVLWLAAGSLPASFLGAQIILRVEDQAFIETTLPQILGSVLVVVGLIILARLTRALGPRETGEGGWPAPPALILIGVLGGFLVGITSIGGGTVIIALLMIFFSIPLNHMVGLDVMHGALLASVPAATYAFSGVVAWDLVGLLLIGSVPGAWLGAKAVSKIDRRIIRGVLGVLIIVAGIHLMFK
jgi:uncharacterized membrane protein YfcA